MSGHQHPRRRAKHLARAAMLSIAALSIASTSSGLISGVHALQQGSPSVRTIQAREPAALWPRHGDHGHDEHADESEHKAEEHAPAPEHEQGHAMPTLEAASGELIPIEHLGGGGGGHHHGGHEPPAYELDEQKILKAAGPVPLSYFEWDFNYGAGADGELLRFTRNISRPEEPKRMGQVKGVWRTLVDEGRAGPQGREALENGIKNMIGEDGRVRSRHAGLLVLHVAGCILACFIILPIALALKAAHSTLAPLATLLYLITLSGSLFFSMLYKSLTPRLYPANAHAGIGYAVFWVSLIALGPDVFRLLAQIYNIIRPSSSRSLLAGSSAFESHGAKWTAALHAALGKHMKSDFEKQAALAEEEEIMLQAGEDGESDAKEIDIEQPHHASNSRRSHSALSSSSGSTRVGNVSPQRYVHFEGDEQSPPPRSPESPTGTLVNTPRGSFLADLHHSKLPWLQTERHVAPGSPSLAAADAQVSPPKTTRIQKFRTFLRFAHVTVNRSLPIMAFVASYTGLAVYTGSCRGGRAPGCAAHGIKGGIFFWYGLLTWGRYLGAYSDLGWAWNKKPNPFNTKRPGVASWRKNAVSAEFVECFVIFFYGATNTWMERFGAAPGSPYSIKDIQHISIAIMFWFAGIVGMLLETKRVRNLLSFSAALNHPSANTLDSQRRANAEDPALALIERQTPPPSYVASFNPFPALVIGVTGIAMAAHHQDYKYQVDIHALWGNLLGGFAVLRCLTYFFLWLRPSTSILPSRPPTEALAAFSLACGGLVFMLSSEEVSFAAMRAGYDDLMAIMNLSIAIISLIFCFTACLLVLKGWALKREFRLAEREGDEQGEGERMRLTSMDRGRETSPYANYTRTLHATIASESEPVFVLEDEETGPLVSETTAHNAASRRYTDSPPPL